MIVILCLCEKKIYHFFGVDNFFISRYYFRRYWLFLTVSSSMNFNFFDPLFSITRIQRRDACPSRR